MRKLIIGATALALALTGCTAQPASAPQVTITKTAIAEPTKASTASKDDTFELMMLAVGTPSWMLEGEILDTLQDVSKNTCGYIRDGMSADDITLALFIILDGSSDAVVEDAFMAATVASVYSYCPEYEGFWD